jgi:signal transduction histidine kinase
VTAPASASDVEPARRKTALRHSLMLRVVTVLAAFIMLMSAALFFGIDHFVSTQFRSLRAERAERLAAQIRYTIEQEQRQMANLAVLLAADADLNNSTYYHLYLEGEKDHPRAAVARIARAFQVHTVSLWSGRGNLIAAVPADVRAPGPPVPPRSPDRSSAGLAPLVWFADRAWLVATAPLAHSVGQLGWLQLARPLDDILPRALQGVEDASARVATDADPPSPDALRIPLSNTAALSLALDVELTDTVGHAIAEVKRLLGWLLAASGVVLAAAFGLFLRWQLRPLVALTQAAASVGRGDFGQRLDERGRGEIGELVDAFNAMSEGLLKLRDLERKVQHQEQLSAIGRVAARVAHDLNNPLTVIRNVVRLAERRLTSDDALAADMELVRHHVERCIRTVENLLAYGRPVNLRAARLDLVQICAGIVRRWRDGPSARPVPVRLETGSEALWINADAYQLEQMLDNLFANAADAGAGAEIVVQTGLSDGRAFVRVTDRGPGFSGEAREHLFEPFFTTKTGGTGLGLASALAIARAHDGDIEIAHDARGGIVTVWLPLAAPPVVAAAR